MTRNEFKTSIVLGMREHHNGKWISPFAAVNDINGKDEPVWNPYELLEELINDGIIDRSHEIVDGKEQARVRYSTAKYKQPTLTLVPNEHTNKDNNNE
jgi:hypothetical protein